MAGLKDRYTLEEGGALFRVKGKAHEDDYGNYTCEADGEQSQFQVRGKPFARLPDNTNVVENQNIKLQCKVTAAAATAAKTHSVFIILPNLN